MAGRILVTGGAGFIGAHVVRHLVATGAVVTVLDDLSTGRAASVPSGVTLHRGDVREPETVMAAMAGVQGVIHLAASVSVVRSVEHWADSHAINLGGTMAVLAAARDAGGVPVVYASSAAVYGDQGARACREDGLPRPRSPYGADKLAGEHQAAAMWHVHGLSSVGLRFFNVYGPGQDAASPYAGVVARFAANRAAGRPHRIDGDGRQSRDFIHVADVVRAVAAALERATAGPPGATVCNVCTGRAVSLMDLADALDRQATSAPLPRLHGPARDGDIRRSLGDPALARRLLGFHAAVELDEGLACLTASQPPNGSSG